MERPPVTIRYESSNGELTLELGSQTISIDELGPRAQGVVLEEEDETRSAFFLTDGEASVLQQMVTYILGNVKIKPTSQEVLEALKPRLEALREG